MKFRALFCLVVLFGCVGCGPAEEVAAPRSRNVVLVLLDTVRADRLGCYGNSEGLTPRLDSFAAGAVRFEQAFAHAPWTLPSVASIFTSQYPAQHGAGGRGDRFTALGEGAVTLAELFKQAEFATGAVVNVMFLTRRFGTAQGFDRVVGSSSEDNVRAEQARLTTAAALQWIDSLGGQPFFLLVHYFDPHLTYDPPSPFLERFADPREAAGQPLFGTVADMINFRRGKLKLNRRAIARLERRHNGEVAYLDSELGRFFDGLEVRGLVGETTVAVTADHGEEFFDHGGFEHGHTLYDELLHVPLIIRSPGAVAGLAVPTTVRHIDLAPTLCDLAGIPHASGFAGESLIGLLLGGPGQDRPVLSQGNMWGPDGVSWRSGGYKVIRQAPRARATLFRVTDDPLEQVDLAAAEPDQCRRLLDDLELVRRGLAVSAGEEALQLSEEETDRLRALGYLD